MRVRQFEVNWHKGQKLTKSNDIQSLLLILSIWKKWQNSKHVSTTSKGPKYIYIWLHKLWVHGNEIIKGAWEQEVQLHSEVERTLHYWQISIRIWLIQPPYWLVMLNTTGTCKNLVLTDLQRWSRSIKKSDYKKMS